MNVVLLRSDAQVLDIVISRVPILVPNNAPRRNFSDERFVYKTVDESKLTAPTTKGFDIAVSGRLGVGFQLSASLGVPDISKIRNLV